MRAPSALRLAAAALALLAGGCSAPAPAPVAPSLTPPAAPAVRASAARRAVPTAARAPLALGLTRTLLDWTHTLEPLPRLPGQAPASGAPSGLALDLAGAPLGAYVSTGAAPAAGLRLDAGARDAALGVRAGADGPGLSLGLEDRRPAPLLGTGALTSRLRIEDATANLGLDFARRLAGTDYRVGVQASDGAQADAAGLLDLQSRTRLPGGVLLRTYWRDPLAGTAQGRRRVELMLDPGGPGRYADALGARCDARGPQLGCGFELGFGYRDVDVRIAPQWRSDPLAAPDTAHGALAIELIGALQRLELEWGGAGPALGYRLDIPLP